MGELTWFWQPKYTKGTNDVLLRMMVSQVQYQFTLWQATGSRQPAYSDSELLRIAKLALSKSPIKVLVVFKEVYVGFLLLSKLDTVSGLMYSLDEFYIEEAYRGQGIGTQTLLHLQHVAKENKVMGLCLNMFASNPARTLYERFGFMPNTIKYNLVF